MPSHAATVIVLLTAALCVTTGCAVRQGVVDGAAPADNRLILDSLPTATEGLAPSDLTPDIARGWEALRDARYDQAEVIFAGAVAGQPILAARQKASAYSGLGFACLGVSRQREAGLAFDNALEAESRYGPAQLGQALRLRLLGQPEESVALYEMLSERYPQSSAIRLQGTAARREAVQVLVQRGEAAEEGRDCETAADSYLRAVDFDPDLPQLHGMLAGALESCGRFEEARLALEQAFMLADGDEAQAFRERQAWLELEHGRPEMAVALFQELLQATTEDPAPYHEGLRQAEEKLYQASIPTEYRELLDGRIPLDRGGLAAIIALENGWDGENETAGVTRSRVIRDAASHWSGRYIRTVVDRGVMDLYQNHTFRPSGPVSRGELAFAACRLLDRCGGDSARDTGAIDFPDLSRDHRHFHCVCRLVSLGLLKQFPDGTVCINTLATGADALELVSAIKRGFAAPES